MVLAAPLDDDGVLPAPWEWMRDAACRGMDPDLFFPHQGHAAREALRVCARCPVRERCLAFALGDHFAYQVGIWGGTGPKERRRLRRAYPRARSAPRARAGS